MGDLEKHVHDANITYHTALADRYDETQPHFKPENVARVEATLANLASQTGGKCLLDLGCGTGFVLNIAQKYFDWVVGIDITPAMIKKVVIRAGRVVRIEANSESLPLPAGQFDVCTAYSFLHHLYDLRPTLAEAFRCLRPGGFFYSDQDPNFQYWALMDKLKGNGNLPQVVAREVQSVVGDVEIIVSETDLGADTVRMAEYQMMQGGLDAGEVTAWFEAAGFRSVTCRPEWYLGQGTMIHQRSATEAQQVETYLRDHLPATASLFKYLSFLAQK